MKIYVAGKFEEGARVREVHQMLKDMGHEITHDWTREDASGYQGAEREAYFRRCAEKDFEGVKDCDLILVLNHDRLFGGATEMGLALAWGRVVYVVEPAIRDNIFYHLGPDLISTFPTLEEALAAIAVGDERDHGPYCPAWTQFNATEKVYCGMQKDHAEPYHEWVRG